MDIRNVALDDLVLDPNLNLRDRLDDFTVERYAEAWDRLPPVTVFEVDDRWLLADGFHRHAAAIMLGKRTLPAEVRPGTFHEALDHVAGANLFHGLPLSRAERRRAVEVKLKLHHDWSDRRTAEELGVSRELVAKVRKQLIEGNQIPDSPGRVGADGKLYATAGLPKDPNENRPRTNEDGGASREVAEPAERGRRGMSGGATPPWEDEGPARAPSGPPIAEEVHFAGGVDPRIIAKSPPIAVDAPSIDELLEVMAAQVAEIVSWTESEGFNETYAQASARARDAFHAAVAQLVTRADELRGA
ncbi:ParB/RepB/Spo0J family partition protein [Paludisphaera sp.]|uniref:ParB/RepB/Spo0J family partition protein n=1 Tax=Paludisphaera sp. TaxID=2017432 RepID=UPI00301CADAA